MKREEQAIQVAVIEFLRLALPHAVVFAIPNAAKRGKIDGAMQKRAGLLAGIPDLCIAADGIVAFIELKTSTGKMSKPQIEVIGTLKSNGIPVAVCRSPEECETFLRSIGMRLRATVHPVDPNSDLKFAT